MTDAGPQAQRFWLNGQATESLPLPSRGFDFGDGLFETLRLSQGRLLLLEAHLARLADGLSRLKIPDCLPTSRSCLISAAAELSAASIAHATLRLTVARGATGRGYRPDPLTEPLLLIAATPLASPAWPPEAAPLSLATSAVRLASQPALVGIKHLNRLEQVLLAADAMEQGVDDVAAQDQAGLVVSVGKGNLFLVEGSSVVTPAINDCGIRGTVREYLLTTVLPGLSVACSEDKVSLDRLLGADEVFCTNSLWGVVPVGQFLDRRWSSHPMSDTLRAELARQTP